jgi:hypothetical protein
MEDANKEEVSEKEATEALEKISAFVVEQIKAGADKQSISEKLVEMGIDEVQAGELVEGIHSEAIRTAEEQKPTLDSLWRGAVGGGVAAVVGGVIWGLIIIFTGYELGIVAWGLGGLAGFAVAFFSGGKAGLPLQLIAVFSSLLGIVIGKYFTFFHFFKEAIAAEHGAEAVADMSLLSVDTLAYFVVNITLLFGGIDILWVGLAVITAWRIPKGIGIKV